MEDYTDYDMSCHNGDSMMSVIDYYSSMEGMGDNFDYMSKVDKEQYIDDYFDYDMVAHNIDYAQASMDDFTAYTVDTMHNEVDNLYTIPHKTTSSTVEWPRFEQGTTYFDSISSSHPRRRHHDKRALAHQDTRDHHIVHQAQCQQALRQREHQEQLRRQRLRERKRDEACEHLKQEHHKEPKPKDISWWTSA
jgi:hypothetical protein